MKKAVVNYWVDIATGLAMLVCAVTGIVRLFPEATSISGGTATILGVSSALWATVHDWSGVAMACGVAVHTVLHFRWLVHMTKRVVRGEHGARAGAAPARTGASKMSGAASGSSTPRVSPQAEVTSSLSRLEAMESAGNGEQCSEPRRMNRKAFLFGAAAVGGAAALAGVALLRHDDGASPSSGSSATDTSSATSTGEETSPWETDSSTANQSSGSSSSGVSSGGTTATGSAPVVVDGAACIGCGHCLQACPHGVFSLDAGKASPTNASSCSLCGRCVQVCGPQAITLSG